ncbi:hypothetical protein C4J81_15125 [Deltaproteobacteria bacterium Smac51]|nr:hypothetical protein C4J81_15125 [Deltaproteobacteria bacterium Smac51]
MFFNPVCPDKKFSRLPFQTDPLEEAAIFDLKEKRPGSHPLFINIQFLYYFHIRSYRCPTARTLHIASFIPCLAIHIDINVTNIEGFLAKLSLIK